jgi:hypothetical protein
VLAAFILQKFAPASIDLTFLSLGSSERKNYQKAGDIRRHFEDKKGQIQKTISDNPRTKEDI